jgi:hypothetical protein
MSKRKAKQLKRPAINARSRPIPLNGLTLTVRTDLRGKLVPNTQFVRMEVLIPRRNGGYDSYTQAFQVK